MLPCIGGRAPLRTGPIDEHSMTKKTSHTSDGELPAEDEEAVFKHYGLTYQPGAGGERRLGRR